MESNREEMIAQFGAIAGVDADRSKFFLESSGWKIETALGSFYEEAEDPPQPAAERPADVSGAQGPSMPKLSMNIADDTDSDEGEAFYTGGSVNSGQQVLGPKKSKDIVSRLFKSAEENGAVAANPNNSDDGKADKKKNFFGTGYKLGETNDDHEVVLGAAKKEPAKDINLIMWKNGFTVDDGPLRGYQDPANHEFLAAVTLGKIPPELSKGKTVGEFFINMIDHRTKEYASTSKKISSFAGTGNTLGSPAPEVIGQVINIGIASGSSRISSAPKVPDSVNSEQKAKDNLKVDESQPTTNIQLRLPEGGRLVLKVNHTHTVADLRQFASTARPLLQQPFALMTTFPYAELKQDSQTIVEANLLNSSIVIK